MKRFSRTIEDFTCANCGAAVKGGGYTNHCPRCLWSRDVDVNPGDRKSECKGMMRPVSATQKSGEWIIVHRCEKCGKERRQRAAKDDDTDKLIKLSADGSFIFGKN